MKMERLRSIVIRSYKTFASEKYDTPFMTLMLAFEALLSFVIVKFVAYTEIDWEAYMQEVTMWQDGEKDYMKIQGGTGPLVYPAGFLYMYGILKWVTDGGRNVVIGQYIFCGLYVFNAAVTMSIYNYIGRTLQRFAPKKSPQYYNTIWSWRVAMVVTCLSKRIHSIFVLRLFNDGPCMILCYISVLLFAKSYWRFGCVFFSLAVSIKMNVLLFAPGLLLLLLQSSPGIWETITCLGICASIQLVLGAPFLLTHPVSYIRKAFEFDRVFFYKWTVNWKFLPEDIFTSKPLSIILLMMHLSFLALFAVKLIKSTRKEFGKAIFIGNQLQPTYIVYTLFVSNFIGIVFARTLHYQFYVWYFHSFPLLLWLSAFPTFTNIVIVGMVEYSFNVFPATRFSSKLLQTAHAGALIALAVGRVPKIRRDQSLKED